MMNRVLMGFFFEVVAPMLYLAVFSFAFTESLRQLIKAWKSDKKNSMVLYMWLTLLGIYFFIQMLKR